MAIKRFSMLTSIVPDEFQVIAESVARSIYGSRKTVGYYKSTYDFKMGQNGNNTDRQDAWGYEYHNCGINWKFFTKK